MELDIQRFSPTRAELVILVEESKHIDLPDLFDKTQLRKVKDARIVLGKKRGAITRRGKELREDALAFQRAVIATEKELVAIIAPEEERLSLLEDMAAKAVERQARIELLPHRKERLATIGDGITVSDDDLLEMDGPAFEGYANKRLADKNEAARIALEAREKAVRDEEARQQRDKELREAEERGRKEAELCAEHEKHEAELKAKEEQERLEREERYQAFLKAHGYTEETKDRFRIERTADEVKLYALAGILKLTN